MILNRYLIREISVPFVPTLGILMALFASYSAADFLSQAVNGLLPTNVIAEMVGLKVLISLEVLIPISLYLSVVLGFGRLYGDSEFAAMSALRVTPRIVWGSVFSVCCGLAMVVALLSIFARPWAYERLHAIAGHAETTLNMSAMEAGTFYAGQDGKRAIFFAHRDRPDSAAHDVFVQLRYKDHLEIISARLARPLPGATPKSNSQVYMRDAHIYELNFDKPHADQVLYAAEMVLNPDAQSISPAEYSAVANTTRGLMGSSTPADVAEFQWRLSTPISTLMLGMLGIPLSRTRPRQSRYAKFGTIILVYFAYYLLCTSARNWVQHGDVPPFPGIWWVPALLAIYLISALYAPYLSVLFARRRA